MPRVRANGIDIAYESLGREGDPAILLIHGLATPLTGWPDSLCDGLVGRGFRIVRFDNRDIGRSTFFPELGVPDIGALMTTARAGGQAAPPYPLDAMAADAAGLLDALGIARAHIAGLSMGGMIAQLVALNHPERAASLVSIMSTTGRRGLEPAKPEAMRALMAVPASASRADRLATAVAAVRAISGSGFPQTEAELAAYVGRSIDYTPFDPPAAARHMAAIVAAPPRHERLNGLRLPALVLHGSEDPVIPPAHGEDTALSIPGARLVIVPGMGHDLKEAMMPTWIDAIGDFANEVEATRA
ncbi:pimeloyl-ACP methyl ester carboxylesterase [Roseiarcus fermentans]|uniref:Pimeloyl-ACP methyl ester carboxylesterase n=1 Tax=Roseiarcus fermentans TaxID=1473586 RepID=A0A366FUP6_9HYPH|nr:alpha/beta hydrolase [Roseiarcus fermentans]RBP18403.1 pimeloyl-ACP methyl ester carboxylesterase [Roseiarcus fermentans]